MQLKLKDLWIQRLCMSPFLPKELSNKWFKLIQFSTQPFLNC
jgi:hypothetical protein